MRKLLTVSVLALTLAATAWAEETTVTDVDLNQDQGKVVDVVSGVKWLGGKIGHGTKVTAQFVYKKGLKPAALGAADLAQLTAKGSVYVLFNVAKGAKETAVTIERVAISGAGDVAKGSQVVYKDALLPLVIKPAVEAGRVVVVDGGYKMFLKPAGQFFVAGPSAAAESEKEGAKATAADIKGDSISVYQVVVKPAADDTAKAAKTVYRGTLKVSCKVANNTIRDTKKDCSFEMNQN